MSTVKAKSKSRSVRKSKKNTMMAISFVMVILVITLLILGFNLRKKVEANKVKAQMIEQQILDEQARTDEIEELEEYMKSDEYIEQVAKDKLGLVTDGEIIFKLTD